MSKKITLNMIVKNETKTLPRLFKSVKDIIDYYIIVDTGSTDGTQKLIKELMTTYGIDGEIYQEKWVNFGFNRQQALEKAIGKTEYILIIDADEELYYKDKNWFKNINKDSYHIKKLYSSVEYYHPALINISHNNRCGWEWKGPVHNYISGSKKINGGGWIDKDNIYIKSYVHGGAKSHNVSSTEKYKKDAAILLDHHKKHPKDTRTIFYLAQSYKDAGDNLNSIKWYKKRSEMGGWSEEVYYSLYSIGICKERLGRDFEKEILYDYLKAFNYSKKRLEALYRIVLYFRKKKKYIESFSYGMLGYKIKKPVNGLFLDIPVHDYNFMFELAISSYYVGFYQLSYDLNQKIIDQKLYPKTMEKVLFSNIQFSENKLQISAKKEKVVLDDNITFFSYDIDSKGGSGFSLKTFSEKIDGKINYTNNPNDVLKFKPKIIFSQQFAIKDAIALKNKLNCKLIVFSRGPSQIKICNNKNTDLCIFNSKYIKDNECGNLNSTVLYPLINYSQYYVTTNNKKYITFMGRSVYCKGGDMFIALASLFPDIEFLCVCYDPQNVSSDYKSEWRPKPLYPDKYNNIEIPNNIKFLPFQKDPRVVYSQTKLMVIPSVIESYGRIVIESSINNIPCLCSDLPGLRESSYNLLEYSDPRDVMSFAKKLELMLKNYEYYVENCKKIYEKYQYDTKNQLKIVKNYLNMSDQNYD